MEKQGMNGSDLQTLKTENEELKKKLDFYKRFIESAGYWETFRDKTGKTIYISPNFEKILGKRKEGYLNGSKKLRDFVHKDDRKKVVENYSKILKGEKVEKHFCRIIRPDDSIAHVSIDYKKVYDNTKTFIGFRTCITEITDQVKAETELKSNLEYMDMIFDTMTEGVALNEIIFNEKKEMVDYRILKVNKAYYKTADYNNKPVIGNVATSLYGMSEEVIKLFWQNHKNAKSVVYNEMESPLRKRTFLIATSPFYNNKFVTSFIDITERKQIERKLNKYKNHLEEIIEERTAELTQKNKELEWFNNLFVNREFRIKELKDKIEELESKLKEN